MAFEGDRYSMANNLFPIYQCQNGLNGGCGLNGGVSFMSIPSVPLHEPDPGSYISWTHNTNKDDYELIKCAQNHIKNRKLCDVTDDRETELQGLVSNILDDADSQDSFYSDGSLSQCNNDIWYPKILQEELLQSASKSQYSSTFAPKYTSHDAFSTAQGQAVNEEVEDLCQATSDGFNANQQIFNPLNEVRDIFSAQHGPLQPPPGLPLPTNIYIPLPLNNNLNKISVSKEMGNDVPKSNFLDLSHVFRPQNEMNGTDMFCKDPYDQVIDKPLTHEQYASQNLNQLVNSFQSFIVDEREAGEFPNLSMQREENVANKWSSPCPLQRGNQTPNTTTRKKLLKCDSLQDLSTCDLQTTEYPPQAKGHHNMMIMQRENNSLPLNMSQFVKHPIQQSPLKFKQQMQKEVKMAVFFGDGFNGQGLSGDILPEEKHPALLQSFPISAHPQRFDRGNHMRSAGSSLHFMPFMDNPRRHQLQNHTFSPRSYRVGVDVGNIVPTNERSGFGSGFNNMICHRGEITYHGMSPTLTSQVQMNQGGLAFQLSLDKCYEQLRSLERARKRTEIILSKSFLTKWATTLPDSSFPKSPNASKVDHLIMKLLKEQARVSSLLDKMACQSSVPIHSNIYVTLRKHQMAISVTSACHREEITNMCHNQHLRGHFTEEKDTMLLAVGGVLKDLATATRKLRTAMWCSLQVTLPKPTPRPDLPISEDNPAERGPASCGGYSYRL